MAPRNNRTKRKVSAIEDTLTTTHDAQQYTQMIQKIVVSIIRQVGFESINRSTLEFFTFVFQQYFHDLISSTAEFTNHAQRTHSNLVDLRLSLMKFRLTPLDLVTYLLELREANMKKILPPSINSELDSPSIQSPILETPTRVSTRRQSQNKYASKIEHIEIKKYKKSKINLYTLEHIDEFDSWIKDFNNISKVISKNSIKEESEEDLKDIDKLENDPMIKMPSAFTLHRVGPEDFDNVNRSGNTDNYKATKLNKFKESNIIRNKLGINIGKFNLLTQRNVDDNKILPHLPPIHTYKATPMESASLEGNLLEGYNAACRRGPLNTRDIEASISRFVNKKRALLYKDDKLKKDQISSKLLLKFGSLFKGLESSAPVNYETNLSLLTLKRRRL